MQAWLVPSVIVIFLAVLLIRPAVVQAQTFLSEQQSPTCSTLLDFTFKRLGQKKTERLCETYQGKLLLVVNTASKCAFTPQYDGLEKLHHDYRDQGLVVLGFPSNDFGGQEPGKEKEILNFCRVTYNVNFPMFEKVHASTDKAHPFYQRLALATGEFPSWNFHKYLITPEGEVIASFKSFVGPDDPDLIKKIKQYLPKS